LDLRVGDDFRRWKLSPTGITTTINLDRFEPSELLEFSEPIEAREGVVIIRPGDFVLVRTLESIILPLPSKLAARVEGRSRFARLGLSVHVTAPTIHAGFSGQITLEMLNHGPFHLQVTPNETALCQLVIEQVAAKPRGQLASPFLGQSTPRGRRRR
jgi:dCTP deaminase